MRVIAEFSNGNVVIYYNVTKIEDENEYLHLYQQRATKGIKLDKHTTVELEVL